MQGDHFGTRYESARYTRTLRIDLPAGQSAFLRGPRKTGKSTLLRQQFPDSVHFDLPDPRLLLEWTRAPWTLSERVLALDPATRARPIVIDEVQKAPAVLDEVHRLIETTDLRFVLCGSSARKLKRGRANLLGAGVAFRPPPADLAGGAVVRPAPGVAARAGPPAL